MDTVFQFHQEVMGQVKETPFFTLGECVRMIVSCHRDPREHCFGWAGPGPNHAEKCFPIHEIHMHGLNSRTQRRGLHDPFVTAHN